ncbi:hypothetical protein WJX81_001388 [Elliptochloris bilobata]|uniref:Alpha-galactosidase n=1 Tax=Elliptochloris bilobata TaxID=381761 RepID=A0AAW1RM04_9CHLO
MGYNTWNAFSFNISEALIRETAELLVSLGLRDAGYDYLCIDDGWALTQRVGNQPIAYNPQLFPSGITALSNYVHAEGLRLGIYSDAGTGTCGGFTGSLGYEAIDALQFAAWGIDLLKYDNCHSPPPDKMTSQARYVAMRDALNATGRPIVYCVCEWGSSLPWTYAQQVGNSWRTTQDIAPAWSHMLENLDSNVGLARFAGPGAWNDPDMLEIGPQSHLSHDETAAHMALWAIMKAPLIIGANLGALENATLAILTAPEVIAINQDPLGIAGDLVWKQGPAEVYASLLAGGARAVVLFNRHHAADPNYKTHLLTVCWASIGIPLGQPAIVRDLYLRTDLGNFTGSFSASVTVHGVRALKITPLRPSPAGDAWRPWLSNAVFPLPCPMSTPAKST